MRIFDELAEGDQNDEAISNSDYNSSDYDYSGSSSDSFYDEEEDVVAAMNTPVFEGGRSSLSGAGNSLLEYQRQLRKEKMERRKQKQLQAEMDAQKDALVKQAEQVATDQVTKILETQDHPLSEYFQGSPEVRSLLCFVVYCAL